MSRKAWSQLTAIAATGCMFLSFLLGDLTGVVFSAVLFAFAVWSLQNEKPRI